MSLGLRCSVVAAFVMAVTIHGQTPSTSRIVGTVTDEDSAALSGVTVEITDGRGTRVVVSDGKGRYAFESVGTDVAYTLTASLPGFAIQTRPGIVIGPGQTATVDVSMTLGCLAIIDFVMEPALDQLLKSHAVLYFRVTANGIDRTVKGDRSCYTANEAPAVILDVVHASRPEWQSNATIQLHTFNDKLRSGEEYVAFMNYNESLQRFTLDNTLFVTVKNGRVDWQNEGLLGLRDRAPIQTALQRLRDTYQRYTRYRQYDSLEPTTSIEKLRYKTGWVAIGTMALRRDVWVDEWKDERPFEFANDPSRARPLPRRSERIRLKKDTEAAILDFGWKGEALRKISPTTRPRDGHVSDWTGARVAAGVEFAVADIQFEPIEESDRRIVWFRLVATGASK